MSHRMKSSLAVLAIAATLLLVSTTACAQDQPAPKWEIFAGYSWADPNTKLNHVPFRNYPVGLGAAGTYDFNKWLGLTLDYGERGRLAVARLLGEAREAGLLPAVTVEFAS